jgi:hypothetical protein
MVTEVNGECVFERSIWLYSQRMPESSCGVERDVSH